MQAAYLYFAASFSIDFSLNRENMTVTRAFDIVKSIVHSLDFVRKSF